MGFDPWRSFKMSSLGVDVMNDNDDNINVNVHNNDNDEDSNDVSFVTGSSLIDDNTFIPRLSRNNFRFATLNVGGFMSKLKYPEISDFIKANEMICLNETQLRDIYFIYFDGYTCYLKNRQSGGVMVIIKNAV